MPVLTILEYPDSRLRKKALPVQAVDEIITSFVNDMLETMYAAPGIGLAATQVNVHKRIVVIDISEEKNTPLCFINPEIQEKTGSEEMEEGCLSVPGIFEKVTRAARIRVRALDQRGQPFEMEAEGLLAVCIQHEIDHLEGRLFVDHLSSIKRLRARKKLEKDRKQAAHSPPSKNNSAASAASHLPGL
ncbi:peptide deformylase [Candidatus Methylospira mobilis]|uniref:Peptide deformylase n=1 Tax=Candidatus Methylospira mobilis TaxID=1808979 RepID=A0A5Q0BPW8_9GAMM|nr:peptide deformylase [Candidatus Methylospira mobilis]QFY44341.1 peptide deformylase [Candidatus Methylospira mobilis]WNV06228.1 peptide deformylase [Candidatus Methylospira mobilis]